MKYLATSPVLALTLVVSSLSSLSSLSACSSADSSKDAGASGDAPRWVGAKGDRLGPLPKQGAAATATFSTSDVCAGCHVAADDSAANRDAKGRNVSPVGLWRPSMMSMAARDPYYLATFAAERAHRPNLTAAVDQGCTPCHAPAGATEQKLAGKTIGFDALVREQAPHAELAREGVGCTLCHQITSEGLGTAPSFTGGFVVGTQRKMFGPYSDPNGQIMEITANFVPTYGPHIEDSKLCATCHTVFTKAIDKNGKTIVELPEQIPYLEWQNSDFTTEGSGGARGTTCANCHVPRGDDENQPVTTAVAKLPKGLAPRTPIGRHGFFGANAYLLRMFADNVEASGALASSADFTEAAQRTEKTLSTAVQLAVAGKRAGANAEVVVTLTNQVGHKFPTGYPSRRAWIHLRATDAGGKVVFESGGTDAYGRLTSRSGERLDVEGVVLPHRDVVDAENQVQVYEAVAGDLQKRVAKRPLDATDFLKDTRLLPAGFSKSHKNWFYMAPRGAETDANFGSADQVTYRFSAPANVKVDVEVLFQSIRPADIEALAEDPTPASRSFFDMVERKPPVPVRVVGTSTAVP